MTYIPVVVNFHFLQYTLMTLIQDMFLSRYEYKPTNGNITVTHGLTIWLLMFFRTCSTGLEAKHIALLLINAYTSFMIIWSEDSSTSWILFRTRKRNALSMSSKRSPRTSGSGSSSTTTMDDNYVDDLLDEDRFSKKKDELEQFQERMKEAKCKLITFYT